MPWFECQNCNKSFEVAQAALDKYPGWTPKACLACRDALATTPRAKNKSKSVQANSAGSKPADQAVHGPRAASREENLTTEEVLAKYTEGPSDGVFTDGAAHPNPGPGGWGAVYVRKGKLIKEVYGSAPHTTNNRMELTALIEGCQLVPKGRAATLWTDSRLCVDTVTRWAAGWERNGWKRKTGAVENLDLVRPLFELCRERPELQLRWIAAHSGNRWNEYADALATAYRRERK